ncbi:hypothetical protein ACTFIU_003672 [Dictyostelium citrinum]
MKIKLINCLLFFIIILNINIVKSDCDQTINVETYNSCGNDPSRLVIKENIYSFESIKVTPFVQPTFDITGGGYFWNLIDGINYTLTYRYKDCSNFISTSFLPKGMYYQLLSEPLCLNTYVPIRVYNWGFNDEPFNTSRVPSLVGIPSQDGNCNLIFSLDPISYSKGVAQNGAFQFKYPTCGFKNGTAIVDLSKGYSNCHLYFQNDYSLQNEIQPSSPCHYNGLDFGSYYLFVDSLECGTERISFFLSTAQTPLEINFENVPDYYHNSTVSLSLSSGNNGILNDTNVFAYISDTKLVLSDWSHQQLPLSTYTTYGYTYKMDFSTNPLQTNCIYQDTLASNSYASEFNFTITKSESCLDNVTITFYPTYPNQNIVVFDYNKETGIPLPISNNVLSIPYNKNLYITAKNERSGILHSTVFDIPSYQIVETSNGIGCWKTYNITIGNYQNYKNLKIKSSTLDGEIFYFYPVDGVFINIPANYYYVTYNAADCETESWFFIIKAIQDIQKNDGSYSDDDDGSTMDISTLRVGNCTHETLFMVTFYTPLGNFNQTYSTSNDMEFNFFVPNTCCKIVGYYQAPLLIDGDSFTYELLTDSNCNSTGNFIKFSSNNNTNKEIFGAFENGLPMNYNNIYKGYNINSGENNITIQYSTDIGTCYKSQTINIKSTFETPIIQISPVTDCSNADGKIEISNYQIFDNIEIFIGSNSIPLNQGIAFNLSSGTYLINYSYNQSCSSSITVFIPTSEDNVEITTSIISNPTCVPSILKNINSDGKISATLKINGIQITNFTIQNQNENYSFYDGGIYPMASVGLNNLLISFGSCIWKRDITTVLNKPKFTLEKVFNDTCSLESVYELVNNNENIDINSVEISNADFLFKYQNNYYIRFSISGNYNLNIGWNTICQDYYSFNVVLDNYHNYNRKYLEYEIVKADNCNSLKIDIIIKNMDKFISLNYNLIYPTQINSTHAIFKNLPPSQSYSFSFILFEGCSYTETIGEVEFKKGNTKESMNIIKTNDVCYSNKGSIQLNNIDFTNYYYYINNLNFPMGIEKSFTPIQPYQNSNNNNNNNTIGLISNLPTGNYKIYRGCKSMVNCYLQTDITIENDNPIIESITVTDSYDKLNNGSVEIKLNYNSSYPINYQIIGTQLSNQNGKFFNLSPKIYEVQVILTDRMCPITLSKSFTIISKTSPPKDPSDELSSSSLIQVNLLLLSILISTIFIF